METSVNAPDTGGGEAVSVVTPAESTGNDLSISQAARALQAARYKKAPESAEPATEPDPVSAQADDAQPETADPVETTEEADPETTPPIEPPRSWTKEAKERWQALPRETQEYLAEREQEREREFRRSQNEAADHRKAIDAERSKVEQARKDFEEALPALLQAIQETQAGQFSDIKTMADVEKLAVEDPFRFTQWQAQQMKIAAVKQQVDQTRQRQEQEGQQKWGMYAQDQDKLAVEKIPDLADKTKAAKLQELASSYLDSLGFTNDELAQKWNTDRTFRDARMQQIILDAARYRELKTKAPVPVPKPVPQVQRPGVSQPRGASDAQQVQNLTSKLERSGSLKDAQALLMARRAASRR